MSGSRARRLSGFSSLLWALVSFVCGARPAKGQEPRPAVPIPAAAAVLEAPAADSALVLAAGARVRVRSRFHRAFARDEQTVKGAIVEVTDSILRVQQDWWDRRPWQSSAPQAIPRAAVLRLEVSRGQDRRLAALKGAGLGALSFAMVLAYAELLIQFDCPRGFECTRDRSRDALAGVVSVAWGAAFGALTLSDRWERVPVERVRATP